jgi:hypothetical protein
MRVRVRIPFAPLFWRRGRGKGDAIPIGETSKTQPVISVACAPGDFTSGPKVALGVKLAGKQGLLIEMSADEAGDLANELLIAVQMSERKHQLRFGTG